GKPSKIRAQAVIFRIVACSCGLRASKATTEPHEETNQRTEGRAFVVRCSVLAFFMARELGAWGSTEPALSDCHVISLSGSEQRSWNALAFSLYEPAYTVVRAS
ncbi:hypothetical protein SPRG_05627, partial [Saprolegnia parasitica CBS 223.65]